MNNYFSFLLDEFNLCFFLFIIEIDKNKETIIEVCLFDFFCFYNIYNKIKNKKKML